MKAHRVVVKIKPIGHSKLLKISLVRSYLVYTWYISTEHFPLNTFLTEIKTSSKLGYAELMCGNTLFLKNYPRCPFNSVFQQLALGT